MCRNGSIDRISQILDAPESLPINKLNALHPTVSTPSRAVVYNNHVENSDVKNNYVHESQIDYEIF